MIYVQLIDYYFILNTAIRTADLELFQYILPKLTNIFFVFNQQNYSRYLVKYHDNLLRINDWHPGLKLQLGKGSFGIKRREKSFSRQPVDLTLEQTINADAANRLTGIVHTTNSLSARQRWCKSHSIRSSIISHTMDRVGLRKRQDVTADLEKSRISMKCSQIQKFTANIQQNVNPFAVDLDSNFLYNISTGQAAKEEIADFLLKIEENGNNQRQNFIQECNADAEPFETSIKRNKILNFTSVVGKKKVSVAGKIIELRMQRDLFGHVLRISLEKTLDIDKVLTYPLTPIPFSLCYVDGFICKTDKSALFK